MFGENLISRLMNSSDHTSEDGPGPGVIINNIGLAFSQRSRLNGAPRSSDLGQKLE